jgi:hypothetical protein
LKKSAKKNQAEDIFFMTNEGMMQQWDREGA